MSDAAPPLTPADQDAIRAYEVETARMRATLQAAMPMQQATAPAPTVAPAVAPTANLPASFSAIDLDRFPDRASLFLHPLFLGLGIDTLGQPIVFRFDYRCTNCGATWQREWNSPEICNCPNCGQIDITTNQSQWIGPMEPAAAEIWRATPGNVAHRVHPELPNVEDAGPDPTVNLPEFLSRRSPAPTEAVADSADAIAENAHADFVTQQDQLLMDGILAMLAGEQEANPAMRRDVPSLMLLFERVLQHFESGENFVEVRAAPRWAWQVVMARIDGIDVADSEIWDAAHAMGICTTKLPDGGINTLSRADLRRAVEPFDEND